MYCWPCILIYLCNKNQLDALFILNLFRQSSSTCFGHICSPSSGGILYIYIYIYIQQLVRVVLFSWLSVGRPDRFSKDIQIFNFLKIRPLASDVFHASGRMDTHDVANSHFSQLLLKRLTTDCNDTGNTKYNWTTMAESRGSIKVISVIFTFLSRWLELYQLTVN
jgi:hypothetical protein